MVIYHIHDYAHAVIMECFYHLLQFSYPNFPAERVRCVRAFRHMVVHGIIAPIVLFLLRMPFIHRSKIKDRLQLNMGDTKSYQMVDSCGDSVGK